MGDGFCLVIMGLALFLNCRAQAHPLDPLTVEELNQAAQIFRMEKGGNTNWLFSMLALNEPEKAEDISWKLGMESRREAFGVVLDRVGNKTYEGVANLKSRSVISWKPIPGVQPAFRDVEFGQQIETLRANPDWQAALRRRGITNFWDVAIIPWNVGHYPTQAPKGARLNRVMSFYKGGQTNWYGPPIEGVEALIDLNQMKVLQVIDTGVCGIGKESTDFFDEKVRGTNRPALKPLIVSQPEGPSFSISGNEIRWDRWRFRYSFDPRVGLVLYQVRYEDEGEERSILYRASISEMLVPYGSPDKTWYWRNAFDVGEYFLGSIAAPLIPGQNCPSHATLLSAPIADEFGGGKMLPNCMAIYERERGALWNHWDGLANSEGRRARELCIGFITTSGNYDYNFQWVFGQDGAIEFVVELTGIVLTKGTDATRCRFCQEPADRSGVLKLEGDERDGTLVAPNTIAVNHQHFLNMRLDFDVDGTANSVKEINLRGLPGGKKNPYKNAMMAEQRVLARERDAGRDVNLASHRQWAIFNPNRMTSLGHQPAYVLEPGENALTFLPQNNVVRQFAGFLDHHFFVTRYHISEMYAAGPYPAHSPKPENLVVWSRDNESIRSEDVVVWYTFGVSHVPRPEDYPVMPAARAGFRLVPKGFFARNPGLDVALH